MPNDYIETSHVFTFLHDIYISSCGKKLFALEGSSGAAKTWGAIDFIIEYCRINSFENKRITIGRETYRDCLDTVAYDFIKRIKQIGIYNPKNHIQSHPQKYFLFGNEIDFTGWSNNGQPSKRQDVLWFNEILESSEEDFKQYNQRTNDIVIFDWNPKVTEHWVYDKLLTRPDCYYKHCTLLNNPFLPEGQRNEILSYEPTKENIQNGTADDYMWRVYGLGLRTSQEGIIFKNVEWIDEFPHGVHFDYGIDFGFTTDPTAITKNAETKTDIWIECLSYEPMETPDIIFEYMLSKDINYRLPITADSSDKYTGEKGKIEMIKSLKHKGCNISPVSKTQSVMFWVNSMKHKRIHLVKNEFYIQLKKEQENYKIRQINGISINQPIDKFNHIWDSARYRHMAFNSDKKGSAQIREFGS